MRSITCARRYRICFSITFLASMVPRNSFSLLSVGWCNHNLRLFPSQFLFPDTSFDFLAFLCLRRNAECRPQNHKCSQTQYRSLSTTHDQLVLVVEMVAVIRAVSPTENLTIFMIVDLVAVGSTGSPARTRWRPIKC